MQSTPIANHPGLYTMQDKGEMAYPITELSIPKYQLASVYNKGEAEEAAARLITAMQEAGEWCGVSMRSFNATMLADVQAAQQVDAEKPFSMLFLMGPQAIWNGLVELRARGMLRVENIEPGNDVVFATPKLLVPQLEAYRRRS